MLIHPFLLKTSILMDLFCFKFPARYKNMTDNTSRSKWHKKLGMDMLGAFQLKTSILINLFYFKIPVGYKNIPDSNWSTCDSRPTSLLVAVGCKSDKIVRIKRISYNRNGK